MIKYSYELSKWDNRFLSLAAHISQFSKYPRTKVGCVIARRDNSLVSIGYNGFTKGADDAELLRLPRDEQLKNVIHAERNAIHQAGVDLTGLTLYVWPLSPCAQCAAEIVHSGISKVVAYCGHSYSEDWQDSFNATKAIFEKNSIEFIEVL